MSALTLRVIGRLLHYPDEAMQQAIPEMQAAVHAEDELPPAVKQRLDAFMQYRHDADLLSLQEQYVNLFDRGRALSLHLFEHVHGESRARGQAMVDLMGVYEQAGFALDAHELPDYLPLLLEFLSHQPSETSAELLGDAMPVIILLGERLAQREADFSVLFEAIEAVVGTPSCADDLRHGVSLEGPDQTIEKMDEIWEEEQVTFMDRSDPTQSGCGQDQSGPSQDFSDLDSPESIASKMKAGVSSATRS